MLLAAAAIVSSFVLRPVYDTPAAGRVAAQYGATQTKYYVPSESVIDASDLARDATIYGPDPLDQTWQVKIYVAPDGAKRLKAWTTEHINQNLGFFVDGKLVSFASVKSPMSDAIMIYGRFTEELASNLARKIRMSDRPANDLVILRPLYAQPAAGRLAADAYGATMYYSPSERIIDTRHLQRDAVRILNGPGGYRVTDNLTPEGSRLFGAWTSAHRGSDFGVFVDGALKNAPKVLSRIDQLVVIGGALTKEEAETLAEKIRRLPARSKTPPSPPAHP